MRIQFLLLSVFLIASCHSPSDKKQINVTGHARLKIVPDMVELSLRAENVRMAMKDAVSQTQADVNEIMAVCRKYVSDPADIKVSSISTNKSYRYTGNGTEVFDGYSAAQVLEVNLRDISSIEKFTEELLATRISRIDNIRYNHTRADSIMREVNLLALEDARKTAEKMCGKMNVNLGTISYLSNFDGMQNNNYGDNYNYNMNLYSKSFGGRGFKMTAEILEFEDVAYASFEID